MAEEILYGIGDILHNGNGEERIIAVEQDLIITCDLDTSKLKFHQYALSEFTSKLIVKEISVSKDIDDSVQVVDFNNVLPKYQEIYRENVSRVEDFINRFGPTYTDFGKKGASCRSLAEKHNISMKGYMKIITKYFQSGCKTNVLYSGNTTGIRKSCPKLQQENREKR